MRILFPFLAVLLALTGCERPSAQVDSAASLSDRISERFNANLGSVNELAVSGAGVRADFQAVSDSSARGFIPQLVPVDSASYDPQAAQLLGAFLPNAPLLARGLREGTYVGERRRDGRPALVVSSEDPELTGGTADGVGRATRVFVDPETFDILEIEQSARIDSFAQPVARRIVYEDFRDVEGIRLPFLIRQLDSGQNQQLSESDQNARRMMLGGELAFKRQQAATLPAGPERDSAVAAADREIQNLEAGIAEVILRVDSIRVTRAE
ncbi:MAG: hypothetical protein Rubg2KO_23450 [Rubricoccaceae bacterium]